MASSTNRLELYRLLRAHATQASTAKAAGIGFRRYVRIEHADAAATPEEQRRLARALGCPVAELFPAGAPRLPVGRSRS